MIDYAPGAVEQKIRHLGCLMMAMDCLGESGDVEMQLLPGSTIGIDGHLYRDGQRVFKGNVHYRTWKDDHNGRLVGDWPLPAGMTAAMVGENAVAVIRLTKQGQQKIKGIYGTAPYEVGVIPHVDKDTGELTYSLVHDFYHSGYGIEEFVGKTKAAPGTTKIEEAHGDLLMYYQAQCAKLAAEEAGHSIEFHKESDGSLTALVDKEGQGMVKA